MKSNLIKNAYPPFLINKVIKKYLGHKFSSNQNQLKYTSVYSFKLPYIGNLSHHIKNKLSKLCKKFCKENFNINLVFNAFQIKSYFSYKDPILDNLKSFLVYKFTCASCSNIKFMIEKQVNYSIAFLDVFISVINNQNLTPQTYHKLTYMGLLLNFKSFTSFSYKSSLIKCLIDRSFKICNNWNSFYKDIESMKSNLIKYAYPPFLINKVIKKYLGHKFSSNQNQLKYTSDVYSFKLPYIGNLSHHIKNKLSKLCKKFCKENFNINLVFNSFQIKSYFSCKDPILDNLKSFLVYKFTCASCSSSYIGKTCHHCKTRIEEHIKKDNKSHIFKHLQSTRACFDLYNSLSFKIIDKANSKFDLKIKKALHINWIKPNVNAQKII